MLFILLLRFNKIWVCFLTIYKNKSMGLESGNRGSVFFLKNLKQLFLSLAVHGFIYVSQDFFPPHKKEAKYSHEAWNSTKTSPNWSKIVDNTGGHLSNFFLSLRQFFMLPKKKPSDFQKGLSSASTFGSPHLNIFKCPLWSDK